MKLTDLRPKWITARGRDGVGVSFDCPCSACARSADKDRQTIAVFFDRPLDGGPALADLKTWQREGDTFEALTLRPSIRFMTRGPDTGLVEHWHGFVTAGELRT